MLRHVRRHEVYWFCRSCWQEMPLLESSANLGLLSASLKHRVAAATLTRSIVTA
ncbi:MAG TPA: hypothetical protein V6C84_15500 [Coleofasciculaceae cyanobacterium]